jgi:hypothetical protein
VDLIQDSFIPPDSARPWHLAREYAEQYQDLSVVDAYDLRPLYPSETFRSVGGFLMLAAELARLRDASRRLLTASMRWTCQGR